MPNRLFYTAKLKSSFIIENHCDIHKNFYELLMANNIISELESYVKSYVATYKNISIIKIFSLFRIKFRFCSGEVIESLFKFCPVFFG